MTASAQIAIYPLRQLRLSPAVDAVQQAFRDKGLQPAIGPMSTYVVGDVAAILAAFQDAFAHASASGHVVMTLTLSNACPLPD